MAHCRRGTERLQELQAEENVSVHSKAIAQIHTQKLRWHVHNLCKPNSEKIPNRGKGGHKVISLPKELLAVDKFWESYNQFSLLMVQPYWVNHPSMKTTHLVYGMYKGNKTRLGGLKGKKNKGYRWVGKEE